MYVSAQHRAIGIVHRVHNARGHACFLLCVCLRRNRLRACVYTRKCQQRSPNQCTSTKAISVQSHNSPKAPDFPASQNRTTAPKLKKEHVDKIDSILNWLPALRISVSAFAHTITMYLRPGRNRPRNYSLYFPDKFPRETLLCRRGREIRALTNSRHASGIPPCQFYC